MSVKNIFTIEARPVKGPLIHEWVIYAYALLTLCIVLVCSTSYPDPETMIWTRVRLVTVTLALWGLYRLVPCPMTMAVRVMAQIVLLGEWYPDTYALNRILPNFDPLVAGWEQAVFASQPAILFSETMPWWWFSELMYLGYGSYYFMSVIIPMLFFFRYYDKFVETTGIVITSFFLFYLIYVIFPVAGPQYYFQAIGVENALAGVFPDVGTHFTTHLECLPLPGDDGPFRALVQVAHDAGERPTAAFPSSHVGIATVLLLLGARYCRMRHSYDVLKWFLPLYILLFFSTVYIKAHYAIDAIGGLVAGTVFYFILSQLFGKR